MISTYTCTGFRPVCGTETQTMAMMIFAGRLARRLYGHSGFCRTHRRASWSPAGRTVTYSVFLGRAAAHDRSVTVGHNEWLTVHRVEA